MATTKIWPIKSSLRKVLHYAENEEKTRIPDLTGLENVMDYAANQGKTAHEQQLFVSGVNCAPEIACHQMELTKQQFGKTDGTVAFHAYQSFPPGEVTAEQCHRLGVELAQRVWGDKFQVLVATHLNTDCCHNHFVLNSVSFVDGKRYNDCKTTYRAFRDASDQLCRENALSVIEVRSAAKTPRAIFMAERRGGLTRYNVMRQDIDLAVSRSFKIASVWGQLRGMGYQVNINPNRKYVTIKMPGDKYPTRLKTLGENYTEEALQQRVQQRLAERSYKAAPPLSARDKYHRYQFSLKIATLFGLKKLYLHYCFLLGVLPKAVSYRSLHPVLQADLRKVEETMEQLKYISRHHVESLDNVTHLTDEKQTALGDLIAQRCKCYNKLRRCTDPDEIAQIRESRDGLSKQIWALRKEIKLLQGIPPRVQTIHRNVDLCEQLEKVQQRQQGRER